MMKVLVEPTDLGLITVDEAYKNGPRTFQYQGHNYVIVRTDSQHTIYGYGKFQVDEDFFAVLNLKSNTIRAIKSGELVKPIDVEVLVKAYVPPEPPATQLPSRPHICPFCGQKDVTACCS